MYIPQFELDVYLQKSVEDIIIIIKIEYVQFVVETDFLRKEFIAKNSSISFEIHLVMEHVCNCDPCNEVDC